MRVLVSHSSEPTGIHLRDQLLASSEISECHTATSLMDTYNFAEHRQPDCVILEAAFADCAEFELLDTLFRMIGTGCVLVRDGHSRHIGRLSLQASEHVVLVSGQPDPEAILQAVRVASQRSKAVKSPMASTNGRDTYDPKRLILFGSSTGGIDALLKTTQQFSTDCPPTVVVQHTGGSFANSLIRLLDRASPARVKEAQDGEPLRPGHIYLPPGDEAHLCLSDDRTARVSLQKGAAVSGHRPSIDALFMSALPFASNVNAALLTGMGRDGAKGLTALREAGAYTIGQNEKTCVVYGMPRVAKQMGGVVDELPLDRIGPALLAASTKQIRRVQ